MGTKAKLAAAVICLFIISGCSLSKNEAKLDPKNPVTITIWHYYNGPIMNALEALIKEFNETVGLDKGIIVEGRGHGNISELESAVLASVNKEIGSLEMPNIFASYADTAYAVEKLGLLADLGNYITKEEQETFIDSYIEEGKIGLKGELRIFPIAKSTEVFMMNETDWLPFAEECGYTYDDLSTMEGITKASEAYYEWTDALTPEIPNDGKSFFGRDSMANLFVIASKMFGEEIFKVENGVAIINVNTDVMRKIWDYYYVPYISGYFNSYGRYRSDDAKVGDILAYVGSTSSASYFPSEVNDGESIYPVTAAILHVPRFEGGAGVMVQQGAGMVVAKSTALMESASVEFLKWFTESDKNIRFALQSGYTPVKKGSLDYDLIIKTADENDIMLTPITSGTLRIAIEAIKSNEMYTNKAFSGGAEARAILESSISDKAVSDRETVIGMLEAGSALKDAVAEFNTDENFNAWVGELKQELEEAAKQ